MKIKILMGDPESWQQFEGKDYCFVNTCKRCQQEFETSQKERIYCGDKCQFATWNDNRSLKPTDSPTVKTPNRR